MQADVLIAQMKCTVRVTFHKYQGGKLTRIADGHWRPNFTTDKYVPCSRQTTACKENKFKHCTDGYIGPRCESCDIKASS
jgi:hypothetical protein